MKYDWAAFKSAYFELHFYITALFSLLHQTKTKWLEVDLMFGLFDDLSQQSSGGSQVIVLIR